MRSKQGKLIQKFQVYVLEPVGADQVANSRL